MATNINGVTSSGPLSDPAPSVGGSFTMYGAISSAGGGGWAESGDMYFEWDQGTGSWTTIGSSGDLSTQDTNPLLTLQTAAEQSAVIDVGGAGSFQVRVRLIEDDLTEYTTTAIDVTVEDLAADRNISNVFDGVSVDDVPAGQGGDCVPDTFSSAGTDDVPTVAVEDPLPLSINVFDEVTVEEGITAVNEDLGSVLVVSEVTLEDVVVSAEILFLGWDNVFDEVTVEEDVTALVEDPAACEVDVFSAAELSEDIGSVTSLADTEVYDEVTLVEDITVSVEEAAAGEDVSINVFSAAVVAEEVTLTGFGVVGWSDDFTGENGDPPNPVKWPVIYEDDCVVDIQSNRLSMKMVGDAECDYQYQYPYTQFGSKVNGNFVVVVDVPAVTWYMTTKNYARLEVRDDDASELAYVEVYSTGFLYWEANTTVSGVAGTAENTSGENSVVSKLRIARIGDQITCSYKFSSDPWVDIFTRTFSTDDLYVRLAPRHTWRTTDQITTYDNFLIDPDPCFVSDSITLDEDITVSISVGGSEEVSINDTISVDEDVTISVSSGVSEIATGDFDEWIDGEPLVGPTGDGDFEEWVDGEPVVIVTEIGDSDLSVSVYDESVVADNLTVAIPSTTWRFQFARNDGDANYLSIREVEMRGSVGGADQCSGGTATASSEFSVTFVPSKAFDDDTETKWATPSGELSGWLQYLFDSAVDVAQYSIDPDTDYDRAPNSWMLERFDTGLSDWVPVDARINETGWSGARTYTRSIPAEGTVWRLNISAVGTAATRAVIQEMEMRESAGGADVCTAANGFAYAHYVYNEDYVWYAPAKAFDGTNLHWMSTDDLPERLYYCFSAEKDIVQYTIQARRNDTGDLNSTPKAWTLEKWTGSAWEVVDTQSDQTGWSYNEVRTYTVGTVGIVAVNVSDTVSVAEDVELALSDAQVNTYDEVSVSEDVTLEVASEPTVVISVFDEVTGDESVECEVPDLFGSVYDEVSIDDVPEGKASDPQVSVDDEVAVAEEVTSRIPVSVEVNDTVTAVEDQASALSVEVWEDDPTTVEETISSFRNILAAGDIRDPGLGVKEIRIKLKAPAQNGYLVTGASIGVRDPGTEDYLPGTVTRITFDGGSVSAAVQSKDLWSDWVVFTAFDHTVDLLIHLDTALLDTVNWNQYSTNGDSYVKNGEFNDCMVEDISGYSFVNYSYNIKSLDVRASMVEGYDVNVYDNEGPSEAVSAVTSGLNVSVYDEASVVESVDVVVTTALSLSVYDEVTVAEAVEGIVSAVILSTDDSITVGEDVAGVASLPGISVYEEVTVEEAVSGDISAVTISTEDGVTVSEDIAGTASLGGIDTYDEISVVDVPTVSSGEITISVYDEVSTDDVAEGQYNLPLSVTDSITVADVPSLLFVASGVFSVVDSVSVVDAATVELGDLTVSIYDEVAVTETVALGIAANSSVYDEVSAADVPDVVLAELIVDVNDSVSVIEIEFSAAPELVIDVYSSSSVSDSAEGVAGDLVFSVFDAVSVDDINTVVVSLPGPIDVPVISDTVGVADAVSATVSDLRVDVYDAVNAVEYVEIYWEYSVGIIHLDCEGLVIAISTEGQGLDVSCIGEYLDIASEGETLSFSCEGQDLTIETEVV